MKTNENKEGKTENLEPVEDDVIRHAATDLGISGLPGLEEKDEGSKDEGKDQDEGDSSEEAQADTNEDEEGEQEEDLDDADTDEQEEESEEEGEDESDDESDSEDQESEGKLPAKLQEKIDKRIGKEVAKRKVAEERLEAASEERKALSEQLSDLQASLSVGVQGVHPMFLVDSESEIDNRENEIMRFRSWARKNKHGYDGSGTPEDPSYTAEEIETRLEQLEDERQVILPRARKIVAARAKNDSHVKTLYPELLDRSSDEFQVMQSFLRQVPGVKRLANVKILIGDMLAGERIRTKTNRKAKTGKSAEKAPAAPKVPDGGSSSGQGSIGKKSKKNAGGHKKAVKQFVESGGSTENLEKVILDGNFV